MNRGGIDGRGDVFEMKREQARGEVDLADVANESDVGVVDGDGEIDLVFFCGNGGLLARGVFFLRLRTCGLRKSSDERQKSEKHKGDAGANVFVGKRVHGCLLVAKLLHWLERPSSKVLPSYFTGYQFLPASSVDHFRLSFAVTMALE